MARFGAWLTAASGSSSLPVNDSMRPPRVELQPHAGGAHRRDAPRADQERQVEARVVRAAVEVQPLGPRPPPGRRVRNRMKTVDLAQARPAGDWCVHASSAPVSVQPRLRPSPDRRARAPGSGCRRGRPPRVRPAVWTRYRSAVWVGAATRTRCRNASACSVPASSSGAGVSRPIATTTSPPPTRAATAPVPARPPPRPAGSPSPPRRRRSPRPARRCEPDARSATAAPAADHAGSAPSLERPVAHRVSTAPGPRRQRVDRA